VRFRLAFAILVDRQLLPLTTQIQDLQNVVSRRDGHYWPSPAQIRTGPIKASGSFRGYLAASRVSLRLSADSEGWHPAAAIGTQAAAGRNRAAQGAGR
jgi:hypothetical protein